MAMDLENRSPASPSLKPRYRLKPKGARAGHTRTGNRAPDPPHPCPRPCARKSPGLPAS